MERSGRSFKGIVSKVPAARTWNRSIGMACVIILLFMTGQRGFAAEEENVFAEPITPEQEMLEKMETEQKAREEMQPVIKSKAKTDALAKYLPPDDSPVYEVREIQFQGNQLLTAEQLLRNVPAVFDASGKYKIPPEPSALYDFRQIHALLDDPSTPRDISARTMQGFTQYVLSQYKARGYSGIFVSVPPETLQAGKLRNDVLLIDVTEGVVSSTSISYYDPEGQPVPMEEGYLSPSFFEKWSPIQVGRVGKDKNLSRYINQLNLNPDRYISAVVSKGEEPETLAVNYNIYEANPWHWFIQVDNAGTEDRRYAPRLGLINTNLFGIDDTLTVYYQAKWEKEIEDKYSVYGSYDFPLWGPRLRLELMAAYNEFDVEGGGGIDFLGKGSLYGAKLRYNAFQKDDWFVDLTTSIVREESKVSSSIFSAILGSQVEMNLWGLGIDVHRRQDLSYTYLTLERLQNIGGSPQSKFWDPLTSTGARTNADNDFTIWTTTASHSQYLDPGKVNRLSGSVRWIVPDERLVPSRMTLFGGMYSVRGYKESGIVADGGILASLQYEYDLVKAEQARYGAEPAGNRDTKPFLRKLAPLAFFDFGRADYRSNVAGEHDEELYSIGTGGLIELGDHFVGAVYYGWPLQATATTDTEDGRLNLSLMMRW